jgi:adenylate cyclase
LLLAERQRKEAEPRYYPDAIVFFSDFAGSTRIASALTPRQVIEELSNLFANFDLIMTKHDCERIETIGDAYLAVAGLGAENATCNAALRMTRAAVAIQEYLSARNEQAEKVGGSRFEARIGIHDGPIIGGIVGRERIRYGIFGDAVNTAQRLEAACAPGGVLVSDSLRSRLLDCESPLRLALESAGEITPKGKAPVKVWTVRTAPAKQSTRSA